MPDLKQPAFLQPPFPADAPDDPDEALDKAKFKADIPTPAVLDVLVTAKNHDVKQARIAHPAPEHWIYALTTLQTQEGFLGRGNYGIVRGMNGGFGNKPLVGLAPGLSFGARFRRDVRVLVEARDHVSALYDPGSGHTLLWTVPWSGAKKDAVTLGDCDPYFIEVCRRIRLTADAEGGLTCHRGITKGYRVDVPASLSGRTDDPWTPVDLGDAKSLTLGGSGFTYQKVQEIVFDKGAYAKPIALEMHDEDEGPMYLLARAMVRGQGKTEGLHHRVVLVPEEVSVLLTGADEGALDALAARAEARVGKGAEVEKRVLRPAVASLLTGQRGAQIDWEQVQPWIDAFDRVVDDRFFPLLWASTRPGVSDDDARRDWQRFLRQTAEAVFADAQQGVPLPDIRRWRALSAARSIFWARLREALPEAMPAPDEGDGAPDDDPAPAPAPSPSDA